MMMIMVMMVYEMIRRKVQSFYGKVTEKMTGGK
jgi:hypothetical protein